MFEFTGSYSLIPKGKKKERKDQEQPIKNNYSLCGLNLDVARLRDIVENIPSAMLIVEKPDGKVTYANKRAVELLGVNPCNFELHKQAENFKILTIDGRVCAREELYVNRALFNEESCRNATAIIEQKSGKQFTVVVSAKPLYDKDGKVNAAVSVFEDVTAHVKTQNSLRESEERLKRAQQIAHLGSWEYNIKEDRAVWSEELFHIFNLKPEKFGPNMKEYFARIHPEDRQMVRMLSRNGSASEASFDYRIIRGDGSVRVLHSERMVREVDESNKPIKVAGIEQDITERKQAEQKLEEYAKNLEALVNERTKQLKDAERMAAIGQTAGMIGHDIRNPLQAIAGELFLMKQEITDSPDSQCKRGVQESLASIQEQVDYINKIVSDLQDFAKPLNPDLVEVDLCTAIPQLLETVNVSDNIRSFAKCEGDLPKIKLDLTFLKRILVNLATNAIQAMPDGGELTITTTHNERYIFITVSDTGVGIPDEVKPKIFQPLMTTKAKGQGFGLAAVKRLVEAQGGTITFESKVGEGTQFKLVFPQ